LNYNLTFDGGYAAIYTNTSNGCGGMIINNIVPSNFAVGSNCLQDAYVSTPTSGPTSSPAPSYPYYKFVYYWNPNWWDQSSSIKVVYTTNEGSASQTMTKCSANGWFYKVLTSDMQDSNYVIFDNGTAYDNLDCLGYDNYPTAFDGAYLAVSTNNSKNCGGNVNYFFYPDASIVGADCMTPTFKRVYYYNPDFYANGAPVNILFPNYGTAEMTQCSNGWFYRQVAEVDTSSPWVIFNQDYSYDNFNCSSDLNYNMAFDGGYVAIGTNSSRGCGGSIFNPFVPLASVVGSTCIGLSGIPTPTATSTPTATPTPTPTPTVPLYSTQSPTSSTQNQALLLISIRILNLNFTWCSDSNNINDFEQLLREDLASILSIPIADIIITSISQGSVIANVTVITSDPASTLATLQAYLSGSNPTFPNLNSELPPAAFDGNQAGTAVADPNSFTSSQVKASKHLTGGQIAGAVIGSVVGAALIAGLIYYFVRRSRRTGHITLEPVEMKSGM